MKGLHKAGHLVGASSLCGACVEVCPVKIPITDILLRLRHDKVGKKQTFTISWSGFLKLKMERIFWKFWTLVFSNPKLYRLKSFGIAKMGNFVPGWLPILRNWTSARSIPNFPKKSLHQLLREKELNDE